MKNMEKEIKGNVVTSILSIQSVLNNNMIEFITLNSVTKHMECINNYGTLIEFIIKYLLIIIISKRHWPC